VPVGKVGELPKSTKVVTVTGYEAN
jgi:hypothetical protein